MAERLPSMFKALCEFQSQHEQESFPSLRIPVPPLKYHGTDSEPCWNTSVEQNTGALRGFLSCIQQVPHRDQSNCLPSASYHSAWSFPVHTYTHTARSQLLRKQSEKLYHILEANKTFFKCVTKLETELIL